MKNCGLVGWFILLLPGICWDIMGFESEPLPSHHEISNCSYSIKLSYNTSLSIPQINLPTPGPTIAPTDSSPVFRSASVHSSYMGRQANLSTMVVLLLMM